MQRRPLWSLMLLQPDPTTTTSRGISLRHCPTHHALYNAAIKSFSYWSCSTDLISSYLILSVLSVSQFNIQNYAQMSFHLSIFFFLSFSLSLFIHLSLSFSFFLSFFQSIQAPPTPPRSQKVSRPHHSSASVHSRINVCLCVYLSVFCVDSLFLTCLTALFSSWLYEHLRPLRLPSLPKLSHHIIPASPPYLLSSNPTTLCLCTLGVRSITAMLGTTL